MRSNGSKMTMPALKAKSFSPEPAITVNGVRLSEGQAMTVRVALATFVMDLSHNGLGEDKIGKSIATGYKERAHEIFGMMGLME